MTDIALIRERLRLHRPAVIPPIHAARGRAAVLVLLINATPEPRLVFTERAHSLGSHAGEVSFPGGKEDLLDSSLVATALRETHEEIGVPTENIEVIGALGPFISKHGLLVMPFVGVIEDRFEYLLNQAEIASLFEVPLTHILSDPRIRTDVIARHGETHHVPAFAFEDYEIWGLTSMILLEFLKVGLGEVMT